MWIKAGPLRRSKNPRRQYHGELDSEKPRRAGLEVLITARTRTTTTTKQRRRPLLDSQTMPQANHSRYSGNAQHPSATSWTS